MRHINKPSQAQGPYCLIKKFEQYVSNKPEKAWGNLGSECKQEITNNYLRPEQYHLCAYTEINLDELGCHIEHIKPKSRYPEYTFDYQNLVLSCFNSDELQYHEYTDRFGGHFKCGDISKGERDKYEPDLFISPLQAECENYFSYEVNGIIEPNPNLSAEEKKRAIYTRDALNLNAPHLVRERRKVIEEMLPIIDDLLDNPEALRHFADADLCVTNGKLNSFHSARLQQFGELGQEILKQCFL
ncbi:MAG: retron system putative HNH endonuclease [Candidatus Parabeggiatoa sp.]|nr:retron system putative HNH endonuclease [Candidatus Parabeggiatoa sp.]